MKTLFVVLVSLLFLFNVTPIQAAEKIVIDGSTTVGPIAKAFAEYYMSINKDVNITVSESGSGNGAKSLINNVCDIADMSRFMKDKEFKAAVEKGVFPTFHVNFEFILFFGKCHVYITQFISKMYAARAFLSYFQADVVTKVFDCLIQNLFLILFCFERNNYQTTYLA